MRRFFGPPESSAQDDLECDNPEEHHLDMEFEDGLDELPEANQAMEYDSDTSNDDPVDAENDDEDIWGSGWSDEREPSEEEAGRENSEPENQPRRKRQRLDIPVVEARKAARINKHKILESALVDIERLIRSRKTKYDGGSRGLQSYRAQAIESYLQLVVRKGYKGIAALEAAAEAFGFAKKWGGRQVRRWVRIWFNDRNLPKSERGCHIKVRSLLEDPAIKAELRTYM